MDRGTRFHDRQDAGRRLAALLVADPPPEPVLVLALPRGGVPVAAEVAQALSAPLEVVVARKIGAPGQPELGIGAVAEGSPHVVVTPTAAQLGVGGAELAALAEVARAQVRDAVARYRADRPAPQVPGRSVVLVDDGLATGVTAEAALRSLRRQRPQQLWLAVPTASASTVRRLAPLADRIVCVLAPEDFSHVGRWYDSFPQTTDAQVAEALAGAPDR